MSLAELLASVADPKLLASAMEQRALFLDIGGELYAACPEEWGWWVWELRADAPEYGCTKALDRCSCPAWTTEHQCKHVLALRHGATSSRWKPPRRRKRGKRPGPRG